ncbi:MAG: aminopeptidase [Deltaproteobacteria bacterium]|jgi:aspartyl aminopeptidase|nr:aminopeptidase [Deltaproteobacteria bacterium]
MPEMIENDKAPDTETENNEQKDKKKSIWDSLDDSGRAEVESLATEYRDFLTNAKTERAVSDIILQKISQGGFVDLKGKSSVKRGGWLAHHGKLLGLFVPGHDDPVNGFNLIVAHGDSPRLDLKPKCVYEDAGLGLLKSNLYGGLKKFQWLARPLAIWGFCAFKDGRHADVRFGEEPGDPVLTITDILPHLDRKVQREKKLTDAFPAERLNVLANSEPLAGSKEKARVKAALLKILEGRWGIKEDDLISSELEIVPAGPAREVGFDGSMIGGYAQDDRLNVFCSVKALLASKKPRRPLLVIIYDREEIGSYGSTGAESNFIMRLAAAALGASGKEPSWANVQVALAATRALSADVEAAVDPTFKEVHDDLNSGLMGHGPCVVRYTGGAGKYGASEARAEYMALIRRIFDEASVAWQSTLLGKQEEGGGGTVAHLMAYHGVSVVDCGPCLLSMHSPFEVSSKADVWMNLKAHKAFLASA